MGLIEGIRALFVTRARPTPQASAAGPDDADEQGVDVERALESLSWVLQQYGRQAVDVGELDADLVRERSEAWARHALYGGSSPAGGPAPTGRDWSNLRREFADTRRREAGAIAASLGDLRSAIWGFARGLSAAIRADQVGDAEVGQQVAKLRRVVRTSSTSEIKREVLAVADAVSRVIADRQERQRSQLLELGERMRALSDELEQAKKKLAIDPLTQLFNRGALDEQIQRIVDLNTISGRPACLMMVDIDRFKAVNDTHGHTAGDEVLRRVADTIVRTFPRRSDFVARYGGEEFLVVLQQDGLDVGAMLAERLLEAIRKLEIPFAGQNLQVTVSAGFAELVPGEDALRWIERADAALYRAKEEGRNRALPAAAEEKAAEASAPAAPSR